MLSPLASLRRLTAPEETVGSDRQAGLNPALLNSVLYKKKKENTFQTHVMLLLFTNYFTLREPIVLGVVPPRQRARPCDPSVVDSRPTVC